MPGELWFRARRYGWGWTPATWQGWAILGAYIIAILGWTGYLVSRPDLTAGLQPGTAVWVALWPILLVSAIVLAR